MDFEYKKLIIEFIGTFFFISIVLNSMNDNRIGLHGIALSLLTVLYFGSNISGGHFNPAVTCTMILDNKIVFNFA